MPTLRAPAVGSCHPAGPSLAISDTVAHLLRRTVFLLPADGWSDLSTWCHLPAARADRVNLKRVNRQPEKGGIIKITEATKPKILYPIKYEFIV